jgi:hypothetical protein
MKIRNNIGFIIVAVLLGAFLTVFIRTHMEYNDCDTLVILKDGKTMEGSAVNYYTNLGVVDVILCSGEHKVVSLTAIETIKMKE